MAGTVLVTYIPTSPSAGFALMPIIIIATTIGGLGEHRRHIPWRHRLRCHSATDRDAVEFRVAGCAAVSVAVVVHRVPADRVLRKEVGMSNASIPQMTIDPPRKAVQIQSLLLMLLPAVIVAILPLLPFVNNYIIAACWFARSSSLQLGQAWNVVAGIGGLLSLGPRRVSRARLLHNRHSVQSLRHSSVDRRLGKGHDSNGVRPGNGRDDPAHARRVLRARDRRDLACPWMQITRHFVDLTRRVLDGLALKFNGDSLWAMQSRRPAPFLYAGLCDGRDLLRHHALDFEESRFGLEMMKRCATTRLLPPLRAFPCSAPRCSASC